MSRRLIHEQTGVSVIIPLYNGIEYLPQAVASVVNQTHNIWELIIGVNGHAPNSDIEKKANEIKNMFIYDNNRIYVKYYTTKGAPLTLNAIARDCKYDYVAFLDADDYWDPSKLEKQLFNITLNNNDVIGTCCRYIGMEVISSDGIISTYISPDTPKNNLDITNHDIFKSNPLIHSSILIKKELIDFDDHFVYDYNLWFKLFLQKKKFFNIPEILVYHRIHKNSAYNNSNSNYLDEMRKKWKKIYDDSGISYKIDIPEAV